MKLNLGCGRDIKEGFVNLDYIPLPGVDVVADLERCKDVPLPFEDNTFSDIIASHLIEHITNILSLMQELHRITKPDGLILIKIPYGSSDDAFEDPTHVRQYFKGSFGYFSQPFYWRADYGYRGDWMPLRIELHLEEMYKGMSYEETLVAVNTYRNVVREMWVYMQAVKPIREPKKILQRAPEIVFV
ncbi:methyltransferase domain-containing protein [Paenibacillus terrigena]|uniref:class I SAM-dependent methyltransferase n=1 Tax=Paenibacillus terrigena TaxID=369333 RepID=UPI0028D0F488|nr:methyltransferase domain-containing protein [Paenibacillus terrigena]